MSSRQPALYSSSPVAPSRFQGGNVFGCEAPSSDPPDVGLEAQDGQLSPSFDASFASSMSMSEAPCSHPIDVCPAPVASKPSRPRPGTFNKNFFESMAANQPSARFFGDEVKPNIIRPKAFGKQRSKSEVILPMALASTKPQATARPNFKDVAARAQSHSVADLHAAEPKRLTSRQRQGIPSEWTLHLKDGSLLRDVPPLTAFETQPPALSPHLEAEEASSPFGDPMDIDPKSPFAPHPGRSEPIAIPSSYPSPSNSTAGNSSIDEFFAPSPQPSSLPRDLQDLPRSSVNNKKRSYEPDTSIEDHDDPSSPLAQALTGRPALHKAASVAGPSFLANRRRGSDRSARPQLPFARALTVNNVIGNRPPAVEVSSPPRNKPSKKSRADETGFSRPTLFSSRRTQSVCDVHAGLVKGHAKSSSNLGIGKPPLTRPAPFAFKRTHTVSASDSLSAVHLQKRVVSDSGMVKRVASESCTQVQTSTSILPDHFGSEADGKALPCHAVKDDGLMRIMPNVVADLVHGKYASLIERFIIVDCRFPWEFEGGHIRGAVNLHLAEQVESFFLSPGNGLRAGYSELPVPSKSGEHHPEGKTVIIFHCEFSEKRAPVAARNLRSKDRARCKEHYPRVHYPEVYVLSGGYATLWNSYPGICEPQGYVQMKESSQCPRAYEDFRRRTALGRARSFTFGDGSAEDPLAGSRPTLDPPQTAPIREEEHENSMAMEESRVGSISGNESSFDPSGDSPCPTTTISNEHLVMRKRVFKGQSLPSRMGMMHRAATENVLEFGSRRVLSERPANPLFD